ncbi:helix-turn-helix domain-containing protein [Microbispora bryophytorum]|uniref:helix-turn-helix domain-containing protein n=1 Tax=Microbispora bryophytorum TaxID=1460882 RepID=UPI0033DCEBF8
MIDDEDLYTADEAAGEVGVSASAIYVWTHRGYIRPVKKRGRVNLYRISDVFAAERNRDRKHRRR